MQPWRAPLASCNCHLANSNCQLAGQRTTYKMWQIVLLALPLSCCWAIVNPANETANMVIYMLPSSELGPHTWQVGVECLDQFAQIFFYRRSYERFTRAYNLVLGFVYNMTTPADQILQGYSARINEAMNLPGEHELFQLRVVNDHPSYKSARQSVRELLLSDNYVIVVDSVARLQRLMTRQISQMRSWNPGARFLVLFNNMQLVNRPHTVATKIFNTLMRDFYVHRVALIYATAPTEYILLVNDYYNNIDCRTLNVQSVGHCSNGTLSPDNTTVHAAMLDYISGFSPTNCTFYVCAAIAAPFIEEDCIIGLEMRILGFMRNWLDFRTNQSCMYETRGELDNKSGNWSGLLGKLDHGECDFILGGFYPDNEVTDSFWTSDCYLEDAHTWYIKLAEQRPFWIAMLGIFSAGSWLGIVLMLLLTWLMWYALVRLLPEPNYYCQFNLTAINALAVTICVAVYERPNCQATRIFFMALTLYGLNIVAIYNSKMIATFQDPGLSHQLDTLEEVVEANIPFGGHEESRDWFENEEDMWIFRDYNYSDEFAPTTENLKAVEQGERCILSSRMFITQNRHADDIYAFPKNIFTSPMQMIMKAGFPFLLEMNLIIRQMRDVGIFQKIDADFRYNNTYLNRIAKMRPRFAANAIVLTTQHLKGPFFILLVGICCSSLAFIGELLFGNRWLRRRWRRRLLRQLQHQQLQRRQLRRQRRLGLRNYGLTLPAAAAAAAATSTPAAGIRFTPVKRRKVL